MRPALDRILLVIALAGCSPVDPQAAHFERLLGRPVSLGEPILSCKRQARPDVSTLSVWRLPVQLSMELRDPPPSSWQLPEAGPNQEEFDVIHWRSGEKDRADREILERGLDELSSIVDDDCTHEFYSTQLREQLAFALGTPNTYYAYKTKKISGTPSVIELAVLSLDAGLLYEIYVEDR